MADGFWGYGLSVCRACTPSYFLSYFPPEKQVRTLKSVSAVVHSKPSQGGTLGRSLFFGAERCGRGKTAFRYRSGPPHGLCVPILPLGPLFKRKSLSLSALRDPSGPYPQGLTSSPFEPRDSTSRASPFDAPRFFRRRGPDHSRGAGRAVVRVVRRKRGARQMAGDFRS